TRDMDRTTDTLARYATSLGYGDLSPSAVKEAKRHLIDSLGCAMGGAPSEPAVIARRLAPVSGGGPSARLLGEGRATTPEAAAFANSAMIRFLDANDTYIARGSGHPSDMLGAILAAAELVGASGRDLVLATVLGYEVFGALGGAGRPFAIERTNFKFFAAEYHAQAPLAVALALRSKVRADEIETLDVQIYAMAHSEIGSEPAKWDPRTRETADHSLPYM